MATKRRATKVVAKPGINPKLLTLAAKLDEAIAHRERLYKKFVRAGDHDEAERVSGIADEIVRKLERKLAKVGAANLEELVLKARYVPGGWVDSGEAVAQSVIDGLLTIGRRQRRLQ